MGKDNMKLHYFSGELEEIKVLRQYNAFDCNICQTGVTVSMHTFVPSMYSFCKLHDQSSEGADIPVVRR